MANVYALMEVRTKSQVGSGDLWAAWGAFQEAFDHYVRIKGYMPHHVDRESTTDSVTGEVHEEWTFDKDNAGWAWISQYRVPLSEIF